MVKECVSFSSTELVSVLFLLVAAVVAMDTPPVVTAVGTYYNVGLTVGIEMRNFIHRRWELSQSSWTYLVATPEALAMNESMYRSTAAVFPELMDELLGIADGSNLSFSQVFFLNTITEIESLRQELSPSSFNGENHRYHQQPLGHCTDVFSSGTTPAASVWGHNEDSGPNDCNLTYIVNATIYDSDTNKSNILERFIAYTYPASVAGRAFGWNHHGLIITTNALFALNNAFDNPRAIPRAFHNRAMYRAASFDEATLLAAGIPTMTAFSLNVGTWTMPASPSLSGNKGAAFLQSGAYQAQAQYHNVETNPGTGSFSVTPVFPRPAAPNWAPDSLKSTTYHLYHANNYLILQGNATTDTSSSARINRLNEFPVPTDSSDVRDMLGDTKNASWPVWQHGCSSGLYTMATVLFDFQNGVAQLFPRNPKTSNAALVFPKL